MPHIANGVRTVSVVDASDVSLKSFQEHAFLPGKPLLMKAGTGSGNSHPRGLPASKHWFEGRQGSIVRLSSYLEPFAMSHLPYELMYSPQPDGRKPLAGFIEWLASETKDSSTASSSAAIRPGLAKLLQHCIASSPPITDSADSTSRLIRLEAPLALFLAAVEYNCTSSTADPVTHLYIAQAPLVELPQGLQQDVPVPDLVQKAGRGDVYDSSVWLGLEPTYTPWHRDPNPNLFCQLCSCKIVRLMAPTGGEHIFRQVQEELMKQQASSSSVSSRIRGEEMMQGPERELLHRAVWGEEDDKAAEGISRGKMLEARLDAGDMLFIPKGWWHSVRSVYADGRLNGSVNWWFR
ncbi:Transcription elongation factor spt6 [Sporothrix bragantina]|uniref:Transcription elongation factor spt6 n=1 Tax=Sporothrix bragantina TaxID=671064 RepID=A0ABP0C254_9PEZI